MFKHSLYRLTAAVLALDVLTVSATAQTACAPRDDVVARLAEAYGESRQAVGLAGQEGVVEVFASEESGTWTITVTSAEGITCLMASGEAFEELPEALPVEADPV